MQKVPFSLDELERLGTRCAVKNSDTYKELFHATKKALRTPPATIFQGIRSVLGKTITKTGQVIDPAKKETA